jgi:hypothetical protein
LEGIKDLLRLLKFQVCGPNSAGRGSIDSSRIEIIIGSYSGEELDSLTKSTKIIITLLQPTETEDDRAVVKACARNGTHYIDAWVTILKALSTVLVLTLRRKLNETFHLRDLIQEYEDIAKETGSIVCSGPALGFEADEGKLLSHVSEASAPYDLLTFSAVSELGMKLSLQTKEAICSVSNTT